MDNGSASTDRNWQGDYRYGFNGKEKDTQGLGGGQSTYDYGFRIYNAALGKFLSVDPLRKEYPWYTPYQFAGNKPIACVDLDGREEFAMQLIQYLDSQNQLFTAGIRFHKIPLGIRENRNNGSFMYTNFNPIGVNFSPKYLSDHPGSILFDPNNVDYLRVLKYSNENNVDDGITEIAWALEIGFDDDKGITPDEVGEALASYTNNLDQTLDQMISILVNNPDALIGIEASASPKVTNINGELSEASKENNKILAEKRAIAARDYIIKRAKEDYNFDIAPDRISTTSSIADDSKGEDNKEDRSVIIAITKF